jgi:MFS family permease
MTTSFPAPPDVASFVPDSAVAWRRLLIGVAIGTVGSVGMWSIVVALPNVQTEFGVTRGDVSLAYTLAMLGFGIGAVLIGRLTDRFGIVPAIGMGVLSLLIGYVGAGVSTSLWQFTLMHFFIGLGASATFAPLMAEASHWFVRRRGIAVTIVASGNYLAGAIWPPLIERGIAHYGWQTTHIAIGIFCAAAMTILVLILRSGMRGSRRQVPNSDAPPRFELGLSANALTGILSLASFWSHRYRVHRRPHRRLGDIADRIRGAGFGSHDVSVL